MPLMLVICRNDIDLVKLQNADIALVKLLKALLSANLGKLRLELI